MIPSHSEYLFETLAQMWLKKPRESPCCSPVHFNSMIQPLAATMELQYALCRSKVKVHQIPAQFATISQTPKISVFCLKCLKKKFRARPKFSLPPQKISSHRAGDYRTSSAPRHPTTWRQINRACGAILITCTL